MSTFRVLISDDMSPKAAEILDRSAAIEVDVRGGIPADELVAAIKEYDGLLVRSRTKVTDAVISAGERLKIVGRAGIGVDNVDLASATNHNVVVENAPNGNSVTTAEHAICLLLSLARHIPQATASMKAGRWDKKKFNGVELCDKTLGVVGLGNIGKIVANRAQGLHIKVIASDPFATKEAAAAIGVELVSFDELLRRADFISVHTPLTDSTRGMFGDDAFGKVKSNLLLVNAARGGVVDEAALVKALDEGKLRGAAVDVYLEEPPPEDHPLVVHPKVICTPHLGASTSEAQDKVAIEVAEQMVAFAERGEVINAVNSVTPKLHAES